MNGPAAGKRQCHPHMMSAVNPQGCEVFSFKHPSATELEHDFLRRTMRDLPESRAHRHLQPIPLRGGAGRARAFASFRSDKPITREIQHVEAFLTVGTLPYRSGEWSRLTLRYTSEIRG